VRYGQDDAIEKSERIERKTVETRRLRIRQRAAFSLVKFSGFFPWVDQREEVGECPVAGPEWVERFPHRPIAAPAIRFPAGCALRACR